MSEFHSNVQFEPVKTQKDPSDHHWFVVEGNIGSGKSTLCRMLKNELKDEAEVIFEPVDKWRSTIDDNTGMNILANFYVDQPRWSYTFQSYTFLTRMEDVMTKQEKPIRFIERSIYTDKWVFARSLFETGKMNSLEWNMYNRWFAWLSEECFQKVNRPSGFIYIRANPETSYQRMLKRERSEEKCVPLEYLKVVSDYHNDWLCNSEQEDVLVIDVDADFENNPEEWSRVRKLIQEFVDSKTNSESISQSC
jgi:deoxyadenosine/deoxycytidine kinase